MLANVPTDPRNWWMFKNVKTGKDAKLDRNLDNGRARVAAIVRWTDWFRLRWWYLQRRDLRNRMPDNGRTAHHRTTQPDKGIMQPSTSDNHNRRAAAVHDKDVSLNTGEAMLFTNNRNNRESYVSRRGRRQWAILHLNQ